MACDTNDLVDNLKRRLMELRAFIREDPLSNPVRLVAHELSVDLEAGNLTLTDLSALIKFLSDGSLETRREHLRRYLNFTAGTDTEQHLANIVENESRRFDLFEDFSAYWQQRRDVVVFTAHPTFILSRKQSQWLSDNALENNTPPTASLKAIDHCPDEGITLEYEHQAVLEAITNATLAISLLNRLLLEQARRRFPGRWRSFIPSPVTLASWVGYDMDGRNDIGWQDVIRHRLKEKLFRLEWYKQELDKICLPALPEAIETLDQLLRQSIKHTAAALRSFSSESLSADALAKAADLLTEQPQKLIRISQLTDLLDQAIVGTDDGSALQLAVLRANMHTFSLGAGEIHFRLNAVQIRNAARHVLQLATDQDLFGRSALDRVQELIDAVEPVQVNFASLSIEKASAARLVIAMAQILKHIDADQPIRLLIAELENPVTVLATIYLAKLFGIEQRIDICPLFETARALDRSRRILDVLFQQPAFRTYAEQRGRIAIQAGFSDAGRFMGQIPASLAIERLHGHFADLMAKHGLAHLEAVVFDTHGESMGRGNHQESVVDRFLYALSPWSRQKFATQNIRLVHESSFQGGDGYVLFGNQPLARAVLSGVLSAHATARDVLAKPDLFYEDISTSLDFYRTVKARQEDLFADKAYHATLSALGLSLLPSTGSRKSRRQFERRGDEDTSLRKIRAIPHNAILQQLGQLANITAGIGQALSSEHDYFVGLAVSSDRFARLMSLVARARGLSDLKTMIAYMKLFDGSFWATRPLSGRESELEQPCAELASALSADKRYFGALQLAARLRSDGIALTRSLTDMNLRDLENSTPLDLDLLHAVRIAIIQHLFLMAARLPGFAPQTGHTKNDVMEMIFSLHIDEAHELLCDIFPVDSPKLSDFNLKEDADYPNNITPTYREIRVELVDPLLECQLLLRHITNGISHYYGAIG